LRLPVAVVDRAIKGIPSLRRYEPDQVVAVSGRLSRLLSPVRRAPAVAGPL